MSSLPPASLPPPLHPEPGWPSALPLHDEPSKLRSSADVPLISIVIPSLNQGRFIEQTIRSILLQNDPQFEIIIIDAQSHDDTAQVVDYYSNWIKHFVSEKDTGQSQAVNKGIKLAAGDWIVWQNSDDFFLPRCFDAFRSVLADARSFDAIYGRTTIVDELGLFLGDGGESEFALDRLVPWLNIHNQATFLHKSIFEQGIFLDETFHYCMDLDFFLRIGQRGARFCFVPDCWAVQRIHRDSKGSRSKPGFRHEFHTLYRRMADDPSLPVAARHKAMQSIISSAHANYADGQAPLFLQDLRYLWRRCPARVAFSTLPAKYVLNLLRPR